MGRTSPRSPGSNRSQRHRRDSSSDDSLDLELESDSDFNQLENFSRTPRGRTVSWWGPLLIATGAALFACTNATSTAFYRRGGTIITVYTIRCVVVFISNGVIVALREGGTAAWDVVLLRSGRRESSSMAYLRGLLGSAQAFGLNLSLVFCTFADAFTIFKGVDSMSTVVMTRTILDSSERLSLRELACGGLTLVGIVLIAQPPLLFGASATHVNAAALAIAACAGMLSAGFGVFTRVLSKEGGPHAAHLSPAMLLSHKMIVMYAFFVCIGLIGRATQLDKIAGFGWMSFKMPVDTVDWGLLAVHCVLTLGAQLALAAGYATTRAGIGGFLQLTELAWVYMIDIVVLAEPTNLFASLGTALVFCSALAVLCAQATSVSDEEVETQVVMKSESSRDYGSINRD